MPPTPKPRGEIEYLDLGLDERSANQRSGAGSAPSPVIAARAQTNKGNVTPTEYHEIDFMKTEALSAIKRGVENKRKSSEKGVDD